MNREEFLNSDFASALFDNGWDVNAVTFNGSPDDYVRVTLSNYGFHNNSEAVVDVRFVVHDLNDKEELAALNNSARSIVDQYTETVGSNTLDQCTKELIQSNEFELLSETGNIMALDISAESRFIDFESIDEIQRYSEFARDAFISLQENVLERYASVERDEPAQEQAEKHDIDFEDGVIDSWDNGAEESWLKEEYTLSVFHGEDGSIFYEATVYAPLYGHETAELGDLKSKPSRSDVEAKMADVLAEKDVDYLLADDLHHRVAIDKDVAMDMLRAHSWINIYPSFQSVERFENQGELSRGPDKVYVCFDEFGDFITEHDRYKADMAKAQQMDEWLGNALNEMYERNGQTEINKVIWYMDEHHIPYESVVTDGVETVTVFNRDDESTVWFEVFHEMGDEALTVTEGLIFDQDTGDFDEDLKADDVIERMDKLSQIVGVYGLTNNMGLTIHAIEYGIDDNVLVSGSTDEKSMLEPKLIPIQYSENGDPFFKWHGQEVRLDEVIRVNDREFEEEGPVWGSQKFLDTFRDVVRQERSVNNLSEGSNAHDRMKDEVKADPVKGQKNERVINMADEEKKVAESEEPKKGTPMGKVYQNLLNSGMSPKQAYAATGRIFGVENPAKETAVKAETVDESAAKGSYVGKIYKNLLESGMSQKQAYATAGKIADKQFAREANAGPEVDNGKEMSASSKYVQSIYSDLLEGGMPQKQAYAMAGKIAGERFQANAEVAETKERKPLGKQVEANKEKVASKSAEKSAKQVEHKKEKAAVEH